MACQLSNKKTCIHNDTSATTRRFMNGVPQGSVLSPTLLNLYIHDIPFPTHPNVHILSYADDITIFSQHPKSETIAAHLQEYICTLEHWLHTNRLKVSPTKSTRTLLTAWSRKQPTVTLNNTPIAYTHTLRTLKSDQ